MRDIFQSTLPYGSDNPRTTQQPLSLNFNPRSLTGATPRVIKVMLVLKVFQSTLPYGSDRQARKARRATKAFQSTLPYGSDSYQPSPLLLESEFQSTLPYGSDHSPLRSPTYRQDFNPRSLTGATNQIDITRIFWILFQSTLPYGSDP